MEESGPRELFGGTQVTIGWLLGMTTLPARLVYTRWASFVLRPNPVTFVYDVVC